MSLNSGGRESVVGLTRGNLHVVCVGVLHASVIGCSIEAPFRNYSRDSGERLFFFICQCCFVCAAGDAAFLFCERMGSIFEVV